MADVTTTEGQPIEESMPPTEPPVDVQSQGRGKSQPSGRLAQALGWVSIGVGMVPLVAPKRIERLLGLPTGPMARAAMLGVAAQELTAGAGLVRGRRPAPWLWSRVMGDAAHLAMLAGLVRSHTRTARMRMDGRSRAMAAAAAVGTMAVIDLVAAGRARSSGGRAVHTRTAVTVNRPPDEVFRVWDQLENLPRFMGHLVSVERRGEGRSHWVATAPGGREVEWDAEVTERVPGRRLSWRSVPGADIENWGVVEFRPMSGDQGTELVVDLAYLVPGGRVGRAVARMLGEHPEQQAEEDVQRFKQAIETGEALSTMPSRPEGI